MQAQQLGGRLAAVKWEGGKMSGRCAAQHGAQSLDVLAFCAAWKKVHSCC